MDLIDRNNIEYQYLPIDTIGDVFITKSKIDQIPSVEMPHWVSTAKKLPEKDGRYICYESSKSETLGTLSTINAYTYLVDVMAHPSGDFNMHRSGFTYYDNHLGRYCIATNIKFWLEGLELELPDE